VRAAARHFVRRHRRDTGYLGWVLRSVGASSALAVALLGLAAAPASAQLPPFGALTGAANPLDGLSVNANLSRPALGDLDGDGDLDVVAGNAEGLFHYFENTGSATGPAFAEQTGAANPLDGQDAGTNAAPSLGDLDGDGDLDLVAGDNAGTFHYYENTGGATSPAFAEQTAAANPLDGQDVGYLSTPSLGDLDGDGDLDLLVGDDPGTFRYYRNTGTAATPAFAEQTAAANPLDGQDVGYFSAPSLSDLDGDGDLDLVAGERDGTLRCYRNTGSATSPAFAEQTGAANPLDGQDVG
jgi:hypothetical protein